MIKYAKHSEHTKSLEFAKLVLFLNFRGMVRLNSDVLHSTNQTLLVNLDKYSQSVHFVAMPIKTNKKKSRNNNFITIKN